MIRLVPCVIIVIALTLIISGCAHLGRSPGELEAVMLPGNVPLEMAWIPAGRFMMGSPETEADRYGVEGPQHQVTIPEGFWMGRFTVTKRQWEAVMGTRPWDGENYVLDDPDSPAVYITWNDATEFIAVLNDYTGLEYRLPSEAEWEYAVRAGTTTRFYWGDDLNYERINDYAWWRENAYYKGNMYAHVVGQKLPNPWGLYDMSGNVWEWCEDDWHDSYEGAPGDGSAWISAPRGSHRVLRGGGWFYLGFLCRSAFRHNDVPDNTRNSYGLRLVRR